MGTVAVTLHLPLDGAGLPDYVDAIKDAIRLCSGTKERGPDVIQVQVLNEFLSVLERLALTNEKIAQADTAFDHETSQRLRHELLTMPR